MAEGDLGAAYLAGARVLVAEDEAVIAFEIETALRELGCVVLGPAAAATDTLGLVTRERPDAALLDVELLDEAGDSGGRGLRGAGRAVRARDRLRRGRDRGASASASSSRMAGAILATMVLISAEPMNVLALDMRVRR